MRGALRLAFVVASIAGALSVSCSHEIESPQVSATRTEPDLACNDKPASRAFSTVSVHGQNMTPMPSKTLEGTRELILPKVTLNMVEPLGGAAASGPVEIADDPANPGASRVKWTSEQLMSFDIRPEDKLPTGVMSVVITNPDGKATVTIEKGLAIVPKPTVATLKPAAICDDQADQNVIVEGSNFLFFDDKAPTVTLGIGKSYTATADDKDCTPVNGNFVEKNVRLCKSIVIKIPKGDIKVTEPTKVDLSVTNPPPADCQSSESIQLTINPPPRVDSVVPSTVCEGGSQLTINGAGFQSGAKVTIDCSGTKVDASTVTVTPDGKQIAASFGPGAKAGETCNVVVTNPDGCEDRPLPHKTVTVISGPILFYVDPHTVYNGVQNRVTLFATTIKQPLPADAVTIVPTGAKTPVTTLTTTPVASYPNRVQATIPKDQAAATYDVTLKDASGCFATLPKALTVVGTTSVTIKEVVPPFGWTNEDTSITIFRDTAAAAPADKPFVDTPRVFLSPSTPAPTDVAVALTGVSFIDKDRVTGVVPKGTAVKKYDVIVVNPDGTVGILKNAYDSVANAPPVITSATPASIPASAGQVVVLTGKNFETGSKVSLSCVNASGAAITPPPAVSGVTCTATSCTITIDGSTLSAGSVCLARVTNADGSYGEYSAIGVTTPSLNLNSPKAGPNMVEGRRALSAAAGDATPSQRFVYALGGDNGTAAGALDTYELAPVDLFGKIGTWTVSPVKLKAKRTLAGAVTVGRYIYLVGGNDGTGPVATAERALILSPRETPEITDLDLVLGAAGLEPGDYHYRVSATFDAADTDNPGGESLASDAFSLRIPSFPGKKVSVTLVWKAPVDSLGAPLAGVNGYRIYRTAKPNDASGTEVLIGTVTGAGTLTFVDDGTKAPGTAKPLPLGSTGNWLQLPSMATKREGLGVAHAFEPGSTSKFYVYGIMGRDTASTATGSYDYLEVTIAANGRQTVGTAWTAGATTNAAPRWQFGTWVATRETTTLINAGDSWIYVGSGRLPSGTGLSGAVDAAKVQAGGALGAWDTSPKDTTTDHAGYGVCAANGQLFIFGGQGGAPTAGARSARIISPVPTLATNSWNNEGLTMTQSRYLLGSAVQSAFIFLLGGQTGEPSAASKTTESVIW